MLVTPALPPDDHDERVVQGALAHIAHLEENGGVVHPAFDEEVNALDGRREAVLLEVERADRLRGLSR